MTKSSFLNSSLKKVLFLFDEHIKKGTMKNKQWHIIVRLETFEELGESPSVRISARTLHCREIINGPWGRPSWSGLKMLQQRLLDSRL